MIKIDGAMGEGGGQILRTSLALSLVTGKPFLIDNIRAGREKPGLSRQHLASVEAAARIGAGKAKGAEPGSRRLYFYPKKVTPGDYHFSIGTAGSCSLVLQTILPALLTVGESSTLRLEGGTHNPFAPPYDFLVKTFFPVLGMMGASVSARLCRHGFYPAGGGEYTVKVTSTPELARVDILERGDIKSIRVRALVSRIPRGVGEREARFVARRLSLPDDHLFVEEIENSPGPGNALMVEVESEALTEVFTGFGMKGVRAEKVAEETVRSVEEYISSGAPVGGRLADQLLIPMALAGGGSFRTVPLTLHTKTNIEVIRSFLDMDIRVIRLGGLLWEISVAKG